MSRSVSMGKNTKRMVGSHFQLIDPEARTIERFGAEALGPFVYHKGYNLMSSTSVSYSSGSLLVEWFIKEDRYVVQAVNASDKKYSTLRVKYEDLGHEIKPKSTLLLMFDIRKNKQTNNITCRVRHVPTKYVFRGWKNNILPRFTIIRKNHKEILENFLGDKLLLDGIHGGVGYQGELLNQIERKVVVWTGNNKVNQTTLSV